MGRRHRHAARTARQPPQRPASSIHDSTLPCLSHITLYYKVHGVAVEAQVAPPFERLLGGLAMSGDSRRYVLRSRTISGDEPGSAIPLAPRGPMGFPQARIDFVRRTDRSYP